MFGCSAKIEKLEREYKVKIESLEDENTSLRDRIYELENNRDNVSSDSSQNDRFRELLIGSYDSGTQFLQRTIEDNLLMLNEINDLNSKTNDRMQNVQEQTQSIEVTTQTIQEHSNTLSDDANSLNDWLKSSNDCFISIHGPL